MAKANKTTQPAPKPQPSPTKVASTTVRTQVSKPSVFGAKDDKLVFGKETYKWMLIGLAAMAIGFVLMSGGAMPDANTWDDNIIYSPMRIIVAPIFILTGLFLQFYAIFKKNG
jgi:hypothetical protein